MNKPVKHEKKNWISLEDFNNDPKLQKRKNDEFTEGVTEDFDLSSMPELSRRKFMALMGASAAFAAASCTDYHDKGQIVPYNKKPEEVIPGIANYYASTYRDGSGLLIKTREGRPIKIDGNPDHPVSRGKISNQAQASVLDLYDPERLRFPQKKSDSELLLFRGELTEEKWDVIDKEIIDELNKASAGGKEIAIITDPVISPSQFKLFEEFKLKYPTTKIYSYEFFNQHTRLTAWEKSHGSRNLPVIEWNNAKTIVALEADFLGTDANAIENIRKFSETRNVDNPDGFSRLYAIEGAYSVTGLNADYRMRLTPEAQFELVAMIAREVAERLHPLEPLNIQSLTLKEFTSKYNLSQVVLRSLIDDIASNKGKSIMYAGDSLPVEVHLIVNYINFLIGASGLYSTENQMVEYYRQSSWDELKSLIGSMKSGRVGVLINFGTNPGWTFPPHLDYHNAVKKVKTVICLTEKANESTDNCKYLLPINHSFESWGDYRLRTGFISLQQPVISPLYNTRQKEAILLNWLGGIPANYQPDIYHKYIMTRWETEIYPALGLNVDFKKFWFSSLHDGIAYLNEPLQADYNMYSFLSTENLVRPKEKSGFTLLLTDNYSIKDGYYANNGWLQELPHPITKVTWDNYAAISPATAKELKVKNDDMVEISLNGTKQVLPVIVQPGLADKLIHAELGYGRPKAGAIGTDVGVDLHAFISKNGGISDFIHTGASVTKKEGCYRLATTQEHHALDDAFVKDKHIERGIIKAGTLNEYIKHPSFQKHKEHEYLLDEKGEPISIVPSKEYKDIKWGMSIDLNKCVGCNLCVTGCNVENNVPVVGKDQAMRGREMQWIRIDRYYSGTPESPVANTLPMLCQHCDNAPCENVCPVVATTHSPDGLNQMIYNRCVGTRYCSNNCPFKVRRFNFFDFRDRVADGFYYKDSISLLHNPEVTVRSRGVMEKCTFCIQRIMEARQNATKDGRTVTGNDVKTACQEACPASAITFGDINDPKSDVSKARKHDLGYHIFEMLNVKPNVTYISRLRNINSEEA